MQDLHFDLPTRELTMKNNDFVLTANPSVQNGGNLLYSKGANPELPMFGIGLIPDVINGPTRGLVFQLNRWKAQAILDGATLAEWSGVNTSQTTANFEVDISYLPLQ